MSISSLESPEEISLQAVHPTKITVTSFTQTRNVNANIHGPLVHSTASTSTHSFSHDIDPAGESYASLFCSEYLSDNDEVSTAFSANRLLF